MSEALISNGPIEDLKAGWALMPFVGRCAHYWTEDKDTMPSMIRDGGHVRYYTSRCGLVAVTDRARPALGIQSSTEGGGVIGGKGHIRISYPLKFR